ncbi:MAG: hypothetical protein WBR18_11035 [Anaerolineales bacterium]
MSQQNPQDTLPRRYLAIDNPGVLAHLADALESVLLQQFDGATEQKPTLSFPSCCHFRDGLHQATALVCNLLQRAFKRSAGDPLSTMLSIDEDAGDSPIWQRRRILVICAAMFEI